MNRDDGNERHECQLLTVREVARLLAVGVRSVWRMASAGQMPRPVKIGRSARWRAAEVGRWIEAGCPDSRESA